jgi:hypothetical protein
MDTQVKKHGPDSAVWTVLFLIPPPVVRTWKIKGKSTSDSAASGQNVENQR